MSYPMPELAPFAVSKGGTCASFFVLLTGDEDDSLDGHGEASGVRCKCNEPR